MDGMGEGPDGMGFDMPMLMNQQPHLFGGYNHDSSRGSPLNNVLSNPTYNEEHGMAGEDNNDAKRRRIARACDMCRKKKIKCDGKMPKCSHCINYKTDCVFTQVEKKRNPPKGAKYIEGLENRLGRMESLLRLSGLLSEDDGKTDLGTLEKRLADRSLGNTGLNSLKSPTNKFNGSSATSQSQHTTASRHSTPRMDSQSSPHTAATSPDSPKESETEVEGLSDMMCSLVTNNCGETRYIGSSSGFSIFSPKGIQWVNEKTGDTSFQDMISSAYVDDNKWMYWKPEIFSDIFARRVFKPLPPKEEALSLFRDFFENFNCMFPLFHEPTFMHLVERQYSRDPYEGSGWWASINVVLAIAHRLRVMSNLVPQEEDKKAWLYLKNAMGVLTELTMRNTDLLSVQALLGMSLFLQGTPNPQPSFFLVAAAIRLSHSIGLHKRGSGFGLNPVEIEQRKRVFWIAYLLDKDICLRSGRPPVQDDDDMNVELPSEDPPDNIGNVPLSDGKGKFNLFRSLCRFATIESRVYKRLYSAKASKQSDGELLNTIGELDRELEEWKDSIPIDFRPEHEIKASHTPLILHVVVLHFSYYNCLTTIHRMSVHHGYWTSRLSNYAIQGLNARPLNPRVFLSAVLCVTAARASINLIKYIPHGDFACVWLILYYPVSALVTLFANILQNPNDARARSDVKLMNVVVNFLSTLVSDESNGSIKRMLGLCGEFERIAQVVLDKAEKESHSKKKRKAAPDEPQDLQQQTPDENSAPSPSTKRPTGPPPATAPFPSSSYPMNLGNTGPDMSNSARPFAPGQPVLATNGVPTSMQESMHTMPGMGHDFPEMLSPNNMDGVGFGDQQPFGTPTETPMTSFQQPFVPQDLWQMPMTIEWDWADMSSNFPVFEGTPNTGP
ncbi:fungal-specific transcription factor domain-containing protein [Aspergillus caelatus]|uniref:Fungal-specific transcription factor domain-containing protein n=2 Tax=Aspergillus subgen. Circumdati TaxID=2720871 RepID=A0A5N6ZRR4_9EURO|nr:fungal-specific transcription factor domain-containing protein [Aspergillus caelatus]KAE8359549.1 fungal-specific transcription factor domain-containing protein [Aspergillus caelatus]KAE8410867.1 fungal-specific transcription factor domain-containing protein [Aspergillus pseudocaelatus]